MERSSPLELSRPSTTFGNISSKSIANYLDRHKPMPLSLLVSLDDDTKILSHGHKLSVPKRTDAGWLIDGQHRLYGAVKAEADVELAVVSFIGLSENEQAEQFVTINKEQKGVPTSLRYDLLKKMPGPKSEAEMAKERATEIANTLRKDETSPFVDRLPIVRPPKQGEISLTNFVRMIYPLVHTTNKSGVLTQYAPDTQEQAINNYYLALAAAFPTFYKQPDSVFFRTMGFGALFSAFPRIFLITIQAHGGFRIPDILKIFKLIDYFDFDTWKTMGSGNQVENAAAEDLLTEIEDRTTDSGGTVLKV
jgi:DGQHR domain-containing protein